MNHSTSSSSLVTPLIHAVSPTFKRSGIEATIFLHSKSYCGVDQDDIQPNSVYLTCTEKNSSFLTFFETMSTSICMPIQIYLDILVFLQTIWPTIKDTMILDLKKLDKKSRYIAEEKKCYTALEGKCVYQRWFETIFFHYIRKSNDSFSKTNNLVHLQTKNVSLQISLSAFKQLADSYDELVLNLASSGYTFDPVSASFSV